MSGESPTPAEALRSMASRALAAHTADDVAQALLDGLRTALAVDQVHLSQVSPDAAVARAKVVDLGRGAEPSDQYTQVFDDRPSGVAYVVATGEPLNVPDARSSTDIRPDYAERFDVGSMLFLPLRWRGDVHHVAILIRHARQPFTPVEIALAEALTQTAALGLALEEAERSRATQRLRDGALARAARALREETSLQDVLTALAREADHAISGDLAGFYVGDARTGGVATAGHNVPPEWHGLVMTPGEGVAGQVLATGRPVITNAYQTEVSLPETPVLRGIQTAVAVPLGSGDELVGALSVGFLRMRRITDEDLRTLEAIADLATVACGRDG